MRRHVRLAVFRRTNPTEEKNYLVVMYHLAVVLWAKGAGRDALQALTALVEGISERAAHQRVSRSPASPLLDQDTAVAWQSVRDAHQD